MRIAIATDWFAPRRGGIETQLVQLAEGLGRRGHDIDVLTSTPGATDGADFSARRVGRTILGTQLALSPTIFHALRRELERGYDVVHAHVSVISPLAYAAAGVARSLGFPTVVTFHSVLRQKRYLLRAIDAIARLSGSLVVWTAVSELVASQVRAALRGAEVTALPNGIDVGFWSSARPSTARRAGEPVTLVSAMRLHRKKRPRRLLSVFAQAGSSAAVPAILRIVGDGPERAAMERDIRTLGLDHGTLRVEMLGWLPREKLRSVYADADGFVLASTRESFGIAALEAAVVGLPVIAMAESGCREFLAKGRKNVLCVDDDDLVRAIARFISDPRRRGSVPDDTASLKRYDWSAVLAEHETTYGRAIRRAAVAATAVAT